MTNQAQIDPNNLLNSYGLIFPGQGSQSTGMMAEFEKNEIIREYFHQASRVLDKDLWEITQKNPDNLLNQTEFTQPVLLTASVGLYQNYLNKNKTYLPAVMAGHSLGEYSALVCSEVVEFEDAVYLVSQRGKFMQEAVPEGVGAMAAIIGLELDKMDQICLEAKQNNEIISSANINAPGQIVIAGHKNAVLKALEIAKSSGAKLVKLLDVSVPSHCLLMKPAADKLEILLNKINFNSPKIPVLQNLDAKYYFNILKIKNNLIKQLYYPVQWVKIIDNMISNFKINKLIESGPGKVLTGLNKRIINPNLNISSVNLLEFQEKI